MVKSLDNSRKICNSAAHKYNNCMKYLSRSADILLEEKLDAFGAVLIEGPKWCGKTTTAKQQAKSVLEMQDPDMSLGYLRTAETKPSLLLAGDTPRLIDEWQDAPVLWDAVRTMVDRRVEPGQFILTGSNAVDRKKIKHSGTGRIARMKMYPMSLWESKESNGKISLEALFDDPKLDVDGITSDMKVEDLVNAACRGGWPASLSGRSMKAKLSIAKEYIDTVCSDDISRVDDVKRDATIARLILKTYARNISTLAKKSVMLKDLRAQIETISDNTMDDYMLALNKLFVIEDVESWSPAIRSATAIRTGMKREFTDPSVAVAALGLTPDALLMDMNTFGFIFETMCIRDLRAYSQAMGGRMAYYHDRYDLEADGVLTLDDGRYALLEFKLGSREIDEGAEHLLEIRDLVRRYNKDSKGAKLREPDLMMVVTGGQMAYNHAVLVDGVAQEDGVKVIPLACLKP